MLIDVTCDWRRKTSLVTLKINAIPLSAAIPAS